MTTQELSDYYKGLLILQYAALPNALGTVEAYITSLIQNQIIQQVQDGFDLATAIGAQLDLLGTYVGAPRILFGVVPADDWSLVPVSDPNPGSYFGWALVAGAAPTDKWLQVNDLDSVPYTLTDTQLRRLIKLMAAIRSSDLGFEGINNILYSAFGAYVNIVDNRDMTIIYQHNHLDPDPDKLWGIAVLAGALPHPAGVSFTVAEV